MKRTIRKRETEKDADNYEGKQKASVFMPCVRRLLKFMKLSGLLITIVTLDRIVSSVFNNRVSSNGKLNPPLMVNSFKLMKLK
jgi:hypothetical protein